MIGIKVCRGADFPGECRADDPSLNWGPDISDPLLTEESVAVERGRIEVDASFTDRITSNVNIAQREYIPMGNLVGINEGGVVKNGMIVSLNISLSKDRDSFSTATDIVIERNI